MEQNFKITDEQMARFIAGTATEEEKNAILEYMSQSDENLDELMSIVDAVQAQRVASSAPTRKTSPAIRSVAASVAVLLLAGGAWMLLRDRGVNLESPSSNTVAMNITPVPSSDASGDDSQLTRTPSHSAAQSSSYSDLIADADPVANATPLAEKNSTSQQGTTQAANSSDGSGILMASSEAISTNPIKTEHDIVFRAPIPSEWKFGTGLTFSWNCNAPVIKLMMKPQGELEWLYLKRITSDAQEWKDGKVIVTAKEQGLLTSNSNKVMWRMEAYFNGGEKTVKEGLITIVK